MDTSKLTVAEFLEQWLVSYAEMNVSAKTLERYQGIVRKHLIPALGSMPLPRLSPLHIQQHYSDALKGGRKDGREGGLSAQSVLHHHRLLHEALQMAVRWQLLARNPADAVEPPRVVERDVEVIDEAKAVWLMDAARGTRLYLPIILAVCAGLRRGEIVGLQWEDFDDAAARLWIRRSLEETKLGGVKFKTPKSKRGPRSVALPATAVDALREHCELREQHREAFGNDYANLDLICCVEDGSIWKPSAFTSAYRALLKRRKLNGPSFHALRHSHASQLVRAGVDIKAVSERLGHSKAGFTLNTYAHLRPGQDDEAAKRIETGLRKAMDQARKSAVM